MNCQIEPPEIVSGKEIFKNKRFYCSSLNCGDIINNCTFINFEGFDITHVGGNHIHLGKFRCRCGKEFITRIRSVYNGHTSSCGCYNKQKVKESNITHNLSKHPLYFTWDRMMKRCNSEAHQDYKNYGGRGIKVCEEWSKDVTTFYEWSINNGYEKGLSIDRIDNNGNYCPENCRWSTVKTQARNRRTNRLINYEDREITLVEYCEIKNLPYYTISKRITGSKWSLEKSLNTPVRLRNKN